MGTITFNRPKRLSGPATPRGDLLLESPPEIPPPSTGANWGMVLRMLPMLAGAGAMALMMSSGMMSGGGRGPLGGVMGGMYGISMLGMMLTQTGRGNDDQAQQLDAARRDYFRYLGQMRKRIRQTAADQRRATMFIHPAPDSLWTVAGTRRMWERRPDDPDFGSVRIGTGQQSFAQRITPPESKPIEDLEPLTVGALRRFMNTHRRVRSMPISLEVPSYRMIQLIGQEEQARELAFAMVSQLAAWHAPTELRMVFCISPENQHLWDWAKWLPHTQHPSRADGAGPVRLFASSASELAQVAEGASGSLEDETLRHIVVITDGVDGVNSGQFAAPGTTATTLEVSRVREAPRRIEQGSIALEVREGVLRVHMRRGRRLRDDEIGPADQLAMVHAEMLARQLAPFRMPLGAVPDVEEEVEEPVFEAPKDYPEMLGVGDPTTLDTNRAWRMRPLHQRLRVPIGLGLNGQPVELDIKEAAMSGMGPHGLCIGATGSGKSEFLRTLVLGLAMTHPPDQLNYVLVDFKGGATFAGLERLPHVSAVITNLEGELGLVDRMQDAIGGELDRRMEVLSATNAKLRNRDIKNREEYDQARLDGADIPPMPSLFIVVDEFSELLTARPEFIDLFIQIGRIGRSIGVHLLLASQRLEESKLRGLDTFLSYRIALRTFSPQESRTVIGVPDAYELPSAPGNAYLKYDTTNMVQLKASYVSGPWKPSLTPARNRNTALLDAADETEEDVWVPPAQEFTAGFVPLAEPPALERTPQRAELGAGSTAAEEELEGEVQTEPEPPADVADDDEEETLLSLVVGRLTGQGWPAHQVWLPPLDVPPTLDELFVDSFGEDGHLVAVPNRGLTTTDSRMFGRLQAPVGLIDRPRQQRRDPMWIDLAGGAGHLGVVGGPQTGKSTVLRSTIMSLSLQNTPAEVGFYCLDFGGGALASLRGLPHVGSVCGRLDADRVKRTIAEMTTLLARREQAFADLGIESMQAYRRGRAQGTVPPDRFPSDVFLVVDNWMTLRQDFEMQEDPITQLANRGLSFGIHVMLTAGKWSEFRMAIRDLLLSRIELKLGDNFESEINRKLASSVPEGRPGRGLSRDGMHSLGAVPRIDGNPDTEELPEGVRAAVTQIREAWQGPKVAEVRMLPDQLDVQALPQVTWDGANRAFPIGVDELELAPVWYDPAVESHLVAFGAPESGKSTLIRTFLQGIVARYRPDEAKILLLDYRRQHLGLVPDEYLVSYCASSTAATDMAKNLADAVRTRMPGPNVTQEELRNRSWWSGTEVFVVIDDYDLVATSMNNPMQPFADLVSQASDIGLHIYIARGMGGASRAVFSDAVIARMKDSQQPGLILSGTKDEGVLLGDVRPSPQPPGRGTWVTRGGGVLVQTVATPPKEF